MRIKPIIIVAGEPNSIFFEIFFKSIKNKKYKSPLILICCKKILKQQLTKFNLKKKIRFLEIFNLRNNYLDNKKINIIDVERKKSLKNYLHNCFEVAFNLIRKKYTYKLINGPINKYNFLDKKFLGVTEYISSNFKEKKTGMLIYNEELSVSPLTTHLPIKLVAKKVTKKLVKEKILIIDNFFKKHMGFRPRIGVTGLNPHCESIRNFNEDKEIITKVIKSLKKKRYKVEGPFAADTIFLKNNRKKYNVILGMYHDQVLTAAKTLFEFDAINITMGLPFLRVSPDHGPNTRMLGKNKSNPISLIKAINFLDKK